VKTKEELLKKLEEVKKDPLISDLELVIIETLKYLVEEVDSLRSSLRIF
jgi:hypothetical protein